MYLKTINVSLKKIFLVAILVLFCSSVNAENNLRDDFFNGKAVICGINLRNFNAQDKNGNKLIDADEESGNFINAIERLDEIKALGINTLHVLPITPTGKLKALGTAGSLYAISDFGSVNPQLIDKKSNLSGIEQATLFVNECHKRGIRVIVDLPSCGSYDFFLRRPELFVKNTDNISVIPSDWTDVRLFNAGNDDKSNPDLMEEHYKFIDMINKIGADGVRADVATIKPCVFWQELISYARKQNPNILFLAEASDSWREPPSEYAPFTPYNELLEVGFDGYYGSFFNLKDWKTSDKLIDHIKFNKRLFGTFLERKNVIMSFTTHDEVSPVISHGEKFSVMISWLDATLPFNPYIIDGFVSGDNYIYPWGNEKAVSTNTDHDYYFVHRGKLDIFNFSAKPQGTSDIIKENFTRAMQFRADNADLIIQGTFSPLKTNFDDIYCYARSYDNLTLVVIGNLNYKQEFKRAIVKVPKLKRQTPIDIIQGDKEYKIIGKRLITDMQAGEIKVLLIKNFSI